MLSELLLILIMAVSIVTTVLYGFNRLRVSKLIKCMDGTTRYDDEHCLICYGLGIHVPSVTNTCPVETDRRLMVLKRDLTGEHWLSFGLQSFVFLLLSRILKL